VAAASSSVRDCLASGRGDPVLLTEIDLTPRRGFGARSGARRGGGHRMTALSILFVGLLPGLKRATEADHLAAVATWRRSRSRYGDGRAAAPAVDLRRGLARQ
jgi:hypothetical protein